MSRVTNQPVIFLAFANDRDDTVGYLRNLPDEARRLRDVLEPAEQAGLCEVVVRSNSTAGDIFKVFQDPKYRNRIAIFHYGGHANGYELLLESPDGKAAVADAGGLAAFLAQQQGMQLVFLNGCSTQQQTQELLDVNISAVISTSRSIDDEVATDFAYQFYQGLAGGATIRTSYNEAEASVKTAKGGNARGLYFGDKDDSPSQLEADRWPWNLYLREGSENADQWNLPDAVNDPLFGLPSLTEQNLPESPYRHLNWFTHKDAEVFFGRGHQIRELYDRLTAPRTAPIMLFYGQSGVGKSSILDAGLIPRLEQNNEVRYLRRSEAGLLATLQLAFVSEASGLPIETAWQVTEEQLRKPLIVFLDQVEEIYTRPLPDLPEELDQLLDIVNATFGDLSRRPRGKLVLGFRKEWLAELETNLSGYELPRTKVFLQPLDRLGIIEVVRGPARSERLCDRYGLTVQDGLAEIIADDLLADRDSAIAPTLQILLTKMWTEATKENYEHPRFSQELYQHLKRDGILLRDFLNQQIAAFRQRYPEAVDSGLLLDIVAMHTTPLGTAGQCSVERLQQHYAHLGATLPDLLQQCQDLHLLTVAASTQKESTKTTRLAHDTLAPLVREQFDVSDKPGQRARRILDARLPDWEDDKTGIPLDDADLYVVELGACGTRAFSPDEERLIAASRSAREKRKRTKKIRQASALTGTMLLIIASLAVTVSEIGKRKAEEQTADAVTKQLKAEQKQRKAEEGKRIAMEGQKRVEEQRREIAEARFALSNAGGRLTGPNFEQLEFTQFPNDLPGLVPHMHKVEVRVLKFSGGDVSALTGLDSLTELAVLDAENCAGLNDVTPLKNLDNLQVLNLHGANLTDATALTTLSQLKVLRVGGKKLTDVTPLMTLRNLTVLSLDDTGVGDDALPGLANLTNLQTLRLNGTEITTLGPLSECKVLEELYVNATDLESVDFRAGFSKLTLLEMNDCKLLKRVRLANLKTLNSLFMQGTTIEQIDLRNLVELDNLRLLNNTQLTTVELLAIPKLKRLTIDSEAMTTFNLSMLPELIGLSVSGAKELPDMPWLGSMTQLENLTLSKTSLSDLKPLGIGNLSELKVLDVSHTQVESLQELSTLRGLQEVDVSKTRVSHEECESFANKKKCTVFKDASIYDSSKNIVDE